MEQATSPLNESLQQPEESEPSSLLWDGPPHAMSAAWAWKKPEYIALVLWIGKDWSWSQLKWTPTAFLFGTAAVIWIGVMTWNTFRREQYAEAYQNVILCLWVAALYAWMMGDLVGLWWWTESEVCQEYGQAVAQWVLLAAWVGDTIFFAVLVPLQVFAEQPFAYPLPSPPASRYFGDFRTYAALHFYMWVIKDCLWAWECPVIYFVAFVITMTLNIDILRRLARHQSKQDNVYIDFWNYVVILLWVLANGLWAFGELVANAAAA